MGAASESDTYFRVTPVGLEVTGDPPLSAWADALLDMRSRERGMQWAIGDPMLFGKERYGEEYSQVLDAADYEDQTLLSCQWVASRFGIFRRRKSLSFSHHLEVASLPPEQADALLDEAERSGWSKRDLRERVRELKAAAPPDPERFNLILESQAIWAWLESRRESWPAEHRGQFFAVARSVLTNMEGEFRDG